MNDVILIQLAKDAFKREFSRDLDVAKREDVVWSLGYIAALKDAVAERGLQTPGLVAALLDMLVDQEREISEFRVSTTNKGST